jgi:2-methylcitrate dehydratase PrpD
MHATLEFEGRGAPLTQARVRVRLRDGRQFEQPANGARGYPERPATEEQLRAKFLSCARRAVPQAKAEQALASLRRLEAIGDVRAVTALLQP